VSHEVVSGLSRLLDRALRRLGDAGEEEPACRIGADAWALLEGPFPAEAQRFNGTLHYLTLAVPKRRHAMPDEEPRAVARVDDIPPGSILRVEAGGTPICLIRTQDGTFYAIDDTCTHEDYSLSEGELWEFEVECPAHGSRFDVRTGEVRNLPATLPVRTHRIRIAKDQVVIES
jgi:3-phenylpropionate/trans-cinnamate dioxygenase ferredoxin subunit